MEPLLLSNTPGAVTHTATAAADAASSTFIGADDAVIRTDQLLALAIEPQQHPRPKLFHEPLHLVPAVCDHIAALVPFTCPVVVGPYRDPR